MRRGGVLLGAALRGALAFSGSSPARRTSTVKPALIGADAFPHNIYGLSLLAAGASLGPFLQGRLRIAHSGFSVAKASSQ